MRPIPSVSATLAALGAVLSRHRAATRISMTGLALITVMGLSQQSATQAGPEQDPLVMETLLPRNVGIAVATNASITIPFDAAMEPVSVESALQVLPAQRAKVSWNEDHTALTLSPGRLWRTDESYLVVIPDHPGRPTAPRCSRRGAVGRPG